VTDGDFSIGLLKKVNFLTATYIVGKALRFIWCKLRAQRNQHTNHHSYFSGTPYSYNIRKNTNSSQSAREEQRRKTVYKTDSGLPSREQIIEKSLA
jgi:hypothetical protein